MINTTKWNCSPPHPSLSPSLPPARLTPRQGGDRVETEARFSALMHSATPPIDFVAAVRPRGTTVVAHDSSNLHLCSGSRRHKADILTTSWLHFMGGLLQPPVTGDNTCNTPSVHTHTRMCTLRSDPTVSMTLVGRVQTYCSHVLLLFTSFKQNKTADYIHSWRFRIPRYREVRAVVPSVSPCLSRSA